MYTIKVYVNYGYYSYKVESMEQAIEHAQTISESGVYRHYCSDESLLFVPVKKVKVCGPELKTAYPDEFHRT